MLGKLQNQLEQISKQRLELKKQEAKLLIEEIVLKVLIQKENKVPKYFLSYLDKPVLPNWLEMVKEKLKEHNLDLELIKDSTSSGYLVMVNFDSNIEVPEGVLYV